MTRIGFGYDVHQLVEGRDLWLGGIKISHTHGLLGHSDADVLIHAVMDALLGAAALCSREAPARHRVLRGMGTVLMVESIFLAVTAAAKLGLYISRFGFTPLRLLSMWGVLVMTAGCVLTIGSLQGLRGAARKWVWFAAATFTALCFF